MRLARVFSLFFFCSVIIDLDHIIRYLDCGNGSAARPAGLIPAGPNSGLQAPARPQITEGAVKRAKRQKKHSISGCET